MFYTVHSNKFQVDLEFNIKKTMKQNPVSGRDSAMAGRQEISVLVGSGELSKGAW